MAEAGDGGPVSGRIEERRRGMFGHKSEFHELRSENRFRVGMMARGYALFAIPDRDTEVRFLTGHVDQRDVLKWVAIGVGALFALGFVSSMVQRLFGGGTPGG